MEEFSSSRAASLASRLATALRTAATAAGYRFYNLVPDSDGCACNCSSAGCPGSVDSAAGAGCACGCFSVSDFSGQGRAAAESDDALSGCLPAAGCPPYGGLSLAAFFARPPADGLLPAALLTEAPLVRAERLTDRRPVFRAALCLVSLGAPQAALGGDALAICRSLTGCEGILAACDFSCAARPGPTLNGARAVDARFDVIMDL